MIVELAEWALAAESVLPDPLEVELVRGPDGEAAFVETVGSIARRGARAARLEASRPLTLWQRVTALGSQE